MTRSPRTSALLATALLATTALVAPGGGARAAEPPRTALPTGGTVVGTSAAPAGAVPVTITTDVARSTLTVNQTVDRAAIDWTSFSVGRDATVRFVQPSAASATLNRVTGSQDPSQILGRIEATGQVWLVNPAGIYFGQGARVDVSGLLATTHDVSTADFLKGAGADGVRRLVLTAGDGRLGTVETDAGAEISVRDAGLAALVAPHVANRGVIAANLGSVVLASGRVATVDLKGNRLINFAVSGPVTERPVDRDGKPVDELVTNSGAIFADGGRVLLTASAAKGVVDRAIGMPGVIQARSVRQLADGTVELIGEGAGAVEVSGTIDVRGLDAETKGGTVVVTGEYAGLRKGAVIDASGVAGGGEVLVGGDYLGGDASQDRLAELKIRPARKPVRNATATYLDVDAVIRADATGRGDGGKVIVWSDGATRAHGTVSARGGPEGGDGGFVETSGKEWLSVDGLRPDTRAAKGRTGQLLLDPESITVATTGATLTYASNGDLDSATGDQAGLDSIITNAALATLLNTTSVTLAATNSISIASDVVKTGNASLTLNAPGVTVSSALSLGGGTLTISGSGAVALTGTITAGSVSVTAGSLTQSGTITTTTGAIIATASSTIQIDGTVESANSSVYLSAGTGLTTGAGATVRAKTFLEFRTNTGDMTLRGSLTATGDRLSAYAPNGTLTLGGSLTFLYGSYSSFYALQAKAIVQTTDATVTVTGDGNGINFVTDSLTLNGAAGSIKATGTSGTNNLTISQQTTTGSVGIGLGEGSGGLSVSQAELAVFSGFESFTFGAGTYSGAVSVAGGIDVPGSLALYGSSITVTGGATAAGSITLTAADNGTVTTSGKLSANGGLSLSAGTLAIADLDDLDAGVNGGISLIQQKGNLTLPAGQTVRAARDVTVAVYNGALSIDGTVESTNAYVYMSARGTGLTTGAGASVRAKTYLDVRANNGDMTLGGSLTATDSYLYAYVQSGTLTLAGTLSFNAAYSYSYGFQAKAIVQTADATLTATGNGYGMLFVTDSLTLNGAAGSIKATGTSGTNTLTIRQLTTNGSVGIGVGEGSGGLSVSQTELAVFSGFESFSFGTGSNSGPVSVAGGVSIPGDLTLYGSSFTVAGGLTATGTITLNGADTGTITTSGKLSANGGLYLSAGTLSIADLGDLDAGANGGITLIQQKGNLTLPSGQTMRAARDVTVAVYNGALSIDGTVESTSAYVSLSARGTGLTTGAGANVRAKTYLDVRANNGDMTLGGSLTATDSYLYAYVQNGTLTLAGALSFNAADSYYYSYGLQAKAIVQNAGATLTATGNGYGIAFTTDSLTLNGAVGSIKATGTSGTNTLTIRQLTTNGSVGIGIGEGSGGLSVSQTELAVFSGFETFSFGSGSGSGPVSVAGGVSIPGDLTLYGSSITVAGGLDAIGTITLYGADNGTITTSGKLMADSGLSLYAGTLAIGDLGDLDAGANGGIYLYQYKGNLTLPVGQTLRAATNVNVSVYNGILSVAGTVESTNGYVSLSGGTGLTTAAGASVRAKTFLDLRTSRNGDMTLGGSLTASQSYLSVSVANGILTLAGTLSFNAADSYYYYSYGLQAKAIVQTADATLTATGNGYGIRFTTDSLTLNGAAGSIRASGTSGTNTLAISQLTTNTTLVLTTGAGSSGAITGFEAVQITNDYGGVRIAGQLALTGSTSIRSNGTLTVDADGGLSVARPTAAADTAGLAIFAKDLDLRGTLSGTGGGNGVAALLIGNDNSGRSLTLGGSTAGGAHLSNGELANITGFDRALFGGLDSSVDAGSLSFYSYSGTVTVAGDVTLSVGARLAGSSVIVNGVVTGAAQRGFSLYTTAGGKVTIGATGGIVAGSRMLIIRTDDLSIDAAASITSNNGAVLLMPATSGRTWTLDTTDLAEFARISGQALLSVGGGDNAVLQTFGFDPSRDSVTFAGAVSVPSLSVGRSMAIWGQSVTLTGTLAATGAASVTLGATGSSGVTMAAGSRIAVVDGDVTLIADQMELRSDDGATGNSIVATGTGGTRALNIRTWNRTATMLLGTATGSGFRLDAAELSQVGDGFTEVKLGGESDYNGWVYFGGRFDDTGPTHLRIGNRGPGSYLSLNADFVLTRAAGLSVDTEFRGAIIVQSNGSVITVGNGGVQFRTNNVSLATAGVKVATGATTAVASLRAADDARDIALGISGLTGTYAFFDLDDLTKLSAFPSLVVGPSGAGSNGAIGDIVVGGSIIASGWLNGGRALTLRTQGTPRTEMGITDGDIRIVGPLAATGAGNLAVSAVGTVSITDGNLSVRGDLTIVAATLTVGTNLTITGQSGRSATVTAASVPADLATRITGFSTITVNGMALVLSPETGPLTLTGIQTGTLSNGYYVFGDATRPLELGANFSASYGGGSTGGLLFQGTTISVGGTANITGGTGEVRFVTTGLTVDDSAILKGGTVRLLAPAGGEGRIRVGASATTTTDALFQPDLIAKLGQIVKSGSAPVERFDRVAIGTSANGSSVIVAAALTVPKPLEIGGVAIEVAAPITTTGTASDLLIGAFGAGGTIKMTTGGAIVSGGGNVELRADAMDLRGGTGSIRVASGVVTGTRELTLATGASATSIGIGTGVTGTLQFDDDELMAIGTGFSLNKIGTGLQNGTVTLGGTFRSVAGTAAWQFGNRASGSLTRILSSFRFVNAGTGTLTIRGGEIAIEASSSATGVQIDARAGQLTFQANRLSIADGAVVRGTGNVRLRPVGDQMLTVVSGVGDATTVGSDVARYTQAAITALTTGTGFAQIQFGPTSLSQDSGSIGQIGNVEVHGTVTLPIQARFGGEVGTASVILAEGSTVGSTLADATGVVELGFRAGPDGRFEKAATASVIATGDVYVQSRVVKLNGASSTMSGDDFIFVAKDGPIGLYGIKGDGTDGDVTATTRIGPTELNAVAGYRRIIIDSDINAANAKLMIGTGTITVDKPLLLYAAGAGATVEFASDASLVATAPKAADTFGLSIYLGDGGTFRMGNNTIINVTLDDMSINGRGITFDMPAQNNAIRTGALSLSLWNNNASLANGTMAIGNGVTGTAALSIPQSVLDKLAGVTELWVGPSGGTTQTVTIGNAQIPTTLVLYGAVRTTPAAEVGANGVRLEASAMLTTQTAGVADAITKIYARSGTFSMLAGARVASGAERVEFHANDFGLAGGNGSIDGTGQISFYAWTTGRSIGLGTATGDVRIDLDELAAIGTGFTSVGFSDAGLAATNTVRVGGDWGSLRWADVSIGSRGGWTILNADLQMSTGGFLSIRGGATGAGDGIRQEAGAKITITGNGNLTLRGSSFELLGDAGSLSGTAVNVRANDDAFDTLVGSEVSTLEIKLVGDRSVQTDGASAISQATIDRLAGFSFIRFGGTSSSNSTALNGAIDLRGRTGDTIVDGTVSLTRNTTFRSTGAGGKVIFTANARLNSTVADTANTAEIFVQHGTDGSIEQSEGAIITLIGDLVLRGTDFRLNGPAKSMTGDVLAFQPMQNGGIIGVGSATGVDTLVTQSLIDKGAGFKGVSIEAAGTAAAATIKVGGIVKSDNRLILYAAGGGSRIEFAADADVTMRNGTAGAANGWLELTAGANGALGEIVMAPGSRIAMGAGTLAFNTDGYTLNGSAGSITGTGNVSLFRGGPTSTIGIGTDTGTIRISQAELDVFSGFSLLTIGGQRQNGAATIASGIRFAIDTRINANAVTVGVGVTAAGRTLIFDSTGAISFLGALGTATAPVGGIDILSAASVDGVSDLWAGSFRARSVTGRFRIAGDTLHTTGDATIDAETIEGTYDIAGTFSVAASAVTITGSFRGPIVNRSTGGTQRFNGITVAPGATVSGSSLAAVTQPPTEVQKAVDQATKTVEAAEKTPTIAAVAPVVAPVVTVEPSTASAATATTTTPTPLVAETKVAAVAQVPKEITTAAFQQAAAEVKAIVASTGSLAAAITTMNTQLGFSNVQQRAVLDSLPPAQIVTALANSAAPAAQAVAAVAPAILTGQVGYAEVRQKLQEAGADGAEARSYLNVFQRLQKEARSQQFAGALSQLRADPEANSVFGRRSDAPLEIVRTDVSPSPLGTGIARVEGQLGDGARFVSMQVNGRWVFVDDQGRYATDVRPLEGTNVMVLSVVDERGQRVDRTLVVDRPPGQRSALEEGPVRRPLRLTQAEADRLDARALADQLAQAPQSAPPRPTKRIALMFALQDYIDDGVPDLATPHADAELVGRALRERLGYETRVVKDATRETILAQIRALGRDLIQEDQVVVYFAGHGYSFSGTELAFWLPVDAEITRANAWVSSADVSRLLHRMPARQILLVADSCYSGSFAADGVTGVSEDLMRAMTGRAVMAITAGGDEPVADGTTNSPFAEALTKQIRSLDGAAPMSRLFETIQAQVSLETPQTPNYGIVRFAGYDDGSDFVVAPPGTVPTPAAPAPAVSSVTPDPAPRPHASLRLQPMPLLAALRPRQAAE